MQRLREVIGHPEGLVIHTGASEGLENVVDVVFLGLSIGNACGTLLLTSRRSSKERSLKRICVDQHTH